ncbi:MAG: Ig-like domain-containing protein [Patescibacteria group bacterium]
MSLFATTLHKDIQSVEHHPHYVKERVHDFVSMPLRAKVFLFVGTVAFAAIIFGLVSLQQPSAWSVGYKAADGKIRTDSGISFSFSRPMSRNVRIVIDPPAPGNWYFENRLSRLHLSREFRFEPVETWLPDTTYTISFEGLRGVFELGDSSQNVAYTFTTQPAPKILSLTPTANEELSPQAIFSLTLDQPNAGLATFELQTDPPVEFTNSTNDDQTVYTFTPKEPLAQGTRYAAQVVQHAARFFLDTGEVSYEGEGRIALEQFWKTTDAPGVESFSPTGTSVSRKSILRVTFTHAPQDSELAKLNIAPTLQGSWGIEGNDAVFTPADFLVADTKYTVTIPKGFAAVGGGFFENDASYSFTTIGAVKVVAMSPGAGATGVAVDRKIRIDFDQAVSHASAQSKFSITPNVEGNFSWDGATLIFTPSSNMALDTGYTVHLASGIESETGMPSAVEYAFTFTTQPTIVRLDVPYDHQDYALSCEVAALKMALTYKGVAVTEDQLMGIVGYDPTPHNGNVWGNPYNAFVGSITGRQSTTGYGVYWEPILKAARTYRDADYFVNGNIQRLTAEINNGNPVVVWGNAGSGKRVDWQTPDGQSIYAINGEHARVVKGYIGSPDNPTKIIVNDPLYGEITYSKASFEGNWGMLFRAGVVVK